ncbi:MAG: hypothetical protein VKN33_02555 [Candidatus Sericytochromatia bacterium]|nr:hypothetical protein [Candidatus Sericytochromatia bacterium]
MDFNSHPSDDTTGRLTHAEFPVPEPPSSWNGPGSLVEDTRIGQLLLRNRVIDLSQLEECLSFQDENPGTLLGEVVVEKGFASVESVHEALKSQLADLRLGQILVRTRCISQEQLDIALVEQENTGELLGAILIGFNFCTPEMIGWAIDQQNKNH